jgi:signal transduction histidine kinase
VEELKRAHRLMSDFVGALSHELRNPLNLIVNSIDLAVEGAFGGLTPEQAEHLVRVARIAENMTGLINAALDLMRAEAGRVAADLREVDVSELVREIDAETRELRKPEVAFVWHAAPNLSRVYTDPAKLKIVLSNIVVNALKFTEQGSVMLDAHPRDGGIEFSIADTGVGIPAAALPTVFEAFSQGHASPLRRRAGAGLGLYIARRLVEMLGGSIAVESEVGRGSIFCVWTPFTLAPAPSET